MKKSAWAACVLLAACEERPDRFNNGVGLSAPVAMDGALVYSAPGRLGFIAVDVETRTPRVHALGVALEQPVRLSTGAVVAFDTSGERLGILRADGSSALYALGAEFDTVWPAEDGTHVLLSRSGSTQGLTNASEVALVDVYAPASATNPARRALPNAGNRITSVVVSPDSPFGRLVFFLSESHIAIVPVDAFPTAAARSVPLAAGVTPRLARFDSPSDGVFDVFFEAAGTADLIHLAFEGEGAPPRPTLNLLPTHGSGADDFLVVPPIADAPRTLLAPVPREWTLALVDPSTGVAKHYQLGLPAARAALYSSELTSAPEVVLYANGSNRFARLALAELPAKKSKAITEFNLAGAVAEVLPAAGGSRFVVSHAGGLVQLTLVDATTSELVPFTGTDTLRSIALSGDTERVYALSYGYPGQITEITVRTAATRAVDAPSVSEMLLVVPSGSGEVLALVGNNELGQVSLSTDFTAWSDVRDFALVGALEEVL